MLPQSGQQLESPDPRVYFAAERTLLAWVRTGLSMMGFGFVVARFGLFLRSIATAEANPSMSHPKLSLWVGTALVLLGMAVNLGAAVSHALTIHRIREGKPIPIGRVTLGMVAALLLVVIGFLMAGYLIFGTTSRA